MTTSTSPEASCLAPLLAKLGEMISQSRQASLRAIDSLHVQTCWNIGRRLIEFEQSSGAPVNEDKRRLPALAFCLTAEYGLGFDASALHLMRGFYLAFPRYDALHPGLSWPHYRILLRVADLDARTWYMNEATTQSWSAHVLDGQVGARYYQRLQASSSPKALKQQTDTRLAGLTPIPRELARDPALLEFLGRLPATEPLGANLEHRLISHMEHFLLERGQGFALVARQRRISTANGDICLDLVLYHCRLKCFVILDLKRGELRDQDIEQMNNHLRLYDEKKRNPDDGPTLGILLRSQRELSRARYMVLDDHEPRFTDWYQLVLPAEEVLCAELDRERALIKRQDFKPEQP